MKELIKFPATTQDRKVKQTQGQMGRHTHLPWSPQWGSSPRPYACEAHALPTELWRPLTSVMGSWLLSTLCSEATGRALRNAMHNSAAQHNTIAQHSTAQRNATKGAMRVKESIISAGPLGCSLFFSLRLCQGGEKHNLLLLRGSRGGKNYLIPVACWVALLSSLFFSAR